MTTQIKQDFDFLAEELKKNHKTINGCLLTQYENIHGLKVLATCTNGTSGTGIFRGKKVYWSYSTPMERFEVELF